MDLSMTVLRVVRQVAESGSFSAAAAPLGFTQSAVSRQVAAAERAAGAQLFDRSSSGAVLTPAGRVFLRQAVVALEAMDQAERTLTTRRAEIPLRLGHFALAGSGVVPALLSAVAVRRPELDVRTREGTSPSLVRGLRAATLDVALVTTRPPHRSPDSQLPPLRTLVVGELALGVAIAARGPLGHRTELTAADLRALSWITSPSTSSEPLLGGWPGLPGRPVTRHVARDWLTKYALVAAGLGVTTVPLGVSAVPASVVVLPVVDLPPEVRRLSLLAGPTLATDLLELLAETIERVLD